MPGGPAPLVIRFGALGDLVMAIPVMRALAERHGRPCDVAAHGTWAPALLAGLPFVGQVHGIPSRNAPYWFSPAQWRLVGFLAAHRGAPALLLESDAKSAWFCARAGLTLSGGIPMAGYQADEHQVDMHRRVAGFDASAAYRRDPELALSATERDACRAWLAAQGVTDGPVLVHAGNKRTQRGSGVNHKEWPQDRWIELIRRIRANDPARAVLLTGTPGEADMTAAIADACRDPLVRSIAGTTPMRRLLALLAIAHGCISVDTGPAHAAAALGCPLVVLFGSTDPRVNGPVAGAGPVRIVSGPADAPVLSGERGWAAHHRMGDIAVTQVVEDWLRVAGCGLRDRHDAPGDGRRPPLPENSQNPTG